MLVKACEPTFWITNFRVNGRLRHCQHLCFAQPPGTTAGSSNCVKDGQQHYSSHHRVIISHPHRHLFSVQSSFLLFFPAVRPPARLLSHSQGRKEGLLFGSWGEGPLVGQLPSSKKAMANCCPRIFMWRGPPGEPLPIQINFSRWHPKVRLFLSRRDTSLT